MVFDRGPSLMLCLSMQKITLYARHSNVLCIYASVVQGVIPVWVMIGSSLLGVLMLAFAEEHKALFARLLISSPKTGLIVLS